MDIKEFFQDAVRKQASDIFLIPGMPLAMKINGRIEPVGEEKVFPAEMDNYIREILRHQRKQRYDPNSGAGRRRLLLFPLWGCPDSAQV